MIRTSILCIMIILSTVGCMKNQEMELIPELTPIPIPDTIITTENGIDQIKTTKLKIGVPPTVDSVPLYLAEENGYFKEQGLDVSIETHMYTSTNKDPFKLTDENVAIMSIMGYLDYKEKGLNAQIITLTDGIFPLIYKNDLDMDKPIRMALVEKGISNYLADYYLKDKTIEKIFISDEVLAIQMLEMGEIDAAFVPEPLAAIAQTKGFKKHIIEPENSVIPNVIVIEQDVLFEEEKLLGALVNAYNKAVNEINRLPEVGKAILVKKLNLDTDISELIVLPTYSEMRMPTETFILEIAKWLSAGSEK
ncbi:MAG: ABC transporter substrate-binding protein [Cellulosilyticaceae bacterium]